MNCVYPDNFHAGAPITDVPRSGEAAYSFTPRSFAQQKAGSTIHSFSLHSCIYPLVHLVPTICGLLWLGEGAWAR